MPDAPDYEIRELSTGGDSIIAETVCRAIDWNPARPISATKDQVLAHPELERYHLAWGREVIWQLSPLAAV